jgi:AraC-like DNA-binding protein
MYVIIGILFSWSSLDPFIRLPADIDNLAQQALLWALGVFLLDIVLYLFGNERNVGGRKVLLRASAVWAVALVLLPLLDYALGLEPRFANVEDGLIRRPLHAFAVSAGYLWPIASAFAAIGLARWNPLDAGGDRPASRLLRSVLAVIALILAWTLGSLMLSYRLQYRLGQLALEFFLLGWYFSIVANPGSLMLLRGEISKEHEKRLQLGESEINLVEERLARITEHLELILDESFDLKKLSDLIGIPSYRLSAFFGTRLATSFPAWRNRIRIEFIRTRMAERPDLSILEISLQAGYRSKASFNQQFSRLVGMSPSKYRKSLGEVAKSTDS